MSWIVGVVVWFALAWYAWALCRVAALSDRRAEALRRAGMVKVADAGGER